MRAWRSKRSKAAVHTDAFSFAPPPFAAPPAIPAPPVVAPAPASEPPATQPPGPESAIEATLVDLPTAAAPEPAAAAAAAPDLLAMQSEFLRLLAVVTSMCDHVIEYIEADRAERRTMIETLAQLSEVITKAAVAPAASATVLELPTPPSATRERVIGGSMPAGPEPVVDLREPTPTHDTEPDIPLGMEAEVPLGTAPEIQLGIEAGAQPPTYLDPRRHASAAIEIAVEVRGRFGDRWVDGFEICEVMTTPAGVRYRLRRCRDGVVLPELFDATSIRHVETFEQLNREDSNGSDGYWSRS